MDIKERIAFLTNYGPWAVVTGASSGIGKALAWELGKIGFDLVLVGRDKLALQVIANEQEKSFFNQIRIIEADLSNEVGNKMVIDGTKDLEVGLLVASAGFGTSGRIIDNKLTDELEMILVNCQSPLILSHEFGKKMTVRRRGGIIFLSSIVAFQGVPFAANYAATKAYIQSLAEGLGRELSPFQVSVLAASPGPVGSGFAKRAGMIMGKTLRPEEIALPILSALGKKGTVFPGFLTKFLTVSLSLLPRWGKVRIMELVMRGFTRHRVENEAANPYSNSKLLH